MPTRTDGHITSHVSKRLLNQVRIYLVVAIIIIGAIIYRLFIDGGDVVYAVLAFCIGIAAGIVVSRMYKVWWDTDAQKVTFRLDLYGVMLLIAYIAFELFGEHYIRQVFAGPMILTMIFSLAGGAVLGRGIGMGRTMIRVFRANAS